MTCYFQFVFPFGLVFGSVRFGGNICSHFSLKYMGKLKNVSVNFFTGIRKKQILKLCNSMKKISF